VINQTSLARPRGRPPAFDRDTVLAQAGETFWRLGYEGASIADLTAAMGITPQSLYGAFTSKAELYRQCLIRYRATVGAFAGRALAEEPTTVAAFSRVLREAAREYSLPDRPRGCMLLTAGLACAAENAQVVTHVAGLRAEILAAFTARIERGKREGDIRAETDAATLARYLQAILQGMSLQARDGAGEAQLADIASVATRELESHNRPPNAI